MTDLDNYIPLNNMINELHIINGMGVVSYYNHIWDIEPTISFTYSNN